MAAFAIDVNGARRSVEADADTPLLWLLRDDLDLKGPKLGCGVGLCGACTVHVDGEPTRSCITPVSSVGNAKVVTIEGVSALEAGRRVQAAWMALDVPQCGYCQAGQIMSATALVRDKPKPTEEEIDAAMTGNLCRCATYTRIRRAIKKACGMPYAQDA